MGWYDFFRKKPRRKVFVIGLDCATPQLVFERWRPDLQNLGRLMDHGLWGELESTIPAITVPAWSSMLSSKDPGTLGCYGFRNRPDYSYDKMTVATGDAVKEKRVWDYIGEAGLESVVIGVPQTFPVRPIKGNVVSGFLTPNTRKDFAYPFSLKREVLSLVPEFSFDVKDFRTEDKEAILKQIYDMTNGHFKVTDYLMRQKPWDFFMVMEIGIDRMHHAFWHFHDPEHPNYVKGNPFENAIRDYYIFTDKKIREWLSRIDENTAVLVVSDHGAKRMDGGICINEWLWRNGYLVFKKDPVPGQIKKFEEMEVDWSKTRAWGSGGYAGRLFMNVKGREPEGVIPRSEYESVRNKLAQEITAITDPSGKPIHTKVYKPEEIYKESKNFPPDLIVYFGDLHWRSVGTLGYDGWHTFENDTGLDSCNHADKGIFILYDPGSPWNNREIKDAHVMDIAPTILSLMGLKVPSDMQGKVLSRKD
jgi:predicted AlkP superfamily phosphohydrolase/phosphomutase